MELTGLTLGQLLGVLGAVGGAVVVLYLLRLRRRRVTVPFVKLWEAVLSERQTTRLFSQLKRWLSLLVALAVVALLAFALGDPRYEGATDEGRSLVVLVDASASMQATDVDPSRFDAAIEETRELVESLGPADRLLIAQMDATARPLSPLTGDRRVLRAAVDSLAVTDMAVDSRAGVRLALDVLRGEPNAEVILVTDGGMPEAATLEDRLEEAGMRLSWIAIGRSSDNVAVSAFSVRRYPLDKSQTEVLMELWNPTDDARQVELTLLGDDEPVEVERLELGPHERLRRFFRNISGVDERLEARIRPTDGGADHLPADDAAYARLPQRRRARVLAVTEENLYLQAALLLDEYLNVTQVTPSEYVSSGDHDVVIFDGFVPAEPPKSHALYLHPDPRPDTDRGPLEVVGTLERPFFDRVDRKHPVVRFTALSDINVGTALEVKTRDGDHVVAADRRGPLIVAGRRNGYRMVALTFDPRQSDLPLRVAWPLLLLNSIDWFVEENDSDTFSSYRTGETWQLPVPAGAEEARIVDPDGRERSVPVVDGRAVYAGTDTGFYTLRTPGSDETFAVNLGPVDESIIEPRESLELAGTKAGTVTEARAGLRKELWLYLVAAALALLMVEWLTYHRRWTV